MTHYMRAPSPGFESIKMPGGHVYKVRNGIVEVHDDHFSAVFNMGFRKCADEPPASAPEVGIGLTSDPPAPAKTPAPSAKTGK